MGAPVSPWSLRDTLAAGTHGALGRARDAITATEPDVRAWVEFAPEPTGPRSGPLGGVPLGVKDIVDVAGLPTRCGSVLRAGAAPAVADAAIVAAWRRAGAVPVGKTVTTEFAYFSPGPTANPAAPGHTPGGSSSGSAAAVAAGHVPLALGSQTAGSVTRPAAYCGVAALVMSRGRFPVDGVTGLAPSLDSHGVLAARVDDLAAAWAALTGEPDPAGRTPRTPRLLLCTAGPLEPPMRAALAGAAERLRAAGTVVDLLDAADVDALTAAHPVVMAYEAARERAVELAHPGSLSVPLAELLQRGAAMPETEYRAALGRVARHGEALAAATHGYDAVLAAAAPGPAPRGLEATGDPVCSRAWQALGRPAVTVPGLRDDAGLPLGLQLVGHAGHDGDLLATGCGVEQVLRA